MIMEPSLGMRLGRLEDNFDPELTDVSAVIGRDQLHRASDVLKRAGRSDSNRVPQTGTNEGEEQAGDESEVAEVRTARQRGTRRIERGDLEERRYRYRNLPASSRDFWFLCVGSWGARCEGVEADAPSLETPESMKAV